MGGRGGVGEGRRQGGVGGKVGGGGGREKGIREEVQPAGDGQINSLNETAGQRAREPNNRQLQ